jgi:hypothetical protein
MTTLLRVQPGAPTMWIGLVIIAISVIGLALWVSGERR